MVVVWVRYGSVQKELGRYQAEVIKEDAELEKKLFASWSMNRKEVSEKFLIPDASPEKWDNYRIKYYWKPMITSENPNFRLFWVSTDFFNAEFETKLRPLLLHPKNEKRAIPNAITFFWETGKGEKFEGRAFFDWKKTNELFKALDNGNNEIQIIVKADNSAFDVLLNGKPLETVNKRIFITDRVFKESYK